MIKFRLGDLGKVVTGATPPSKEEELYGDYLPFLTPTDMTFNDRHVRTSRGVSQAGADRFRSRVVPQDAVAVVCIGATIGKVCMTESETLTNQQVNTIVVDESRNCPEFVYYLLRTMVERLQNVAGGAATPILNKSAFSNLEVTVPRLPAQREIARRLASLDDLIEDNRRRIEILEETARLIYREWFVHFRYPGHEEVALVDSDLGLVPEDWDVEPVGEVVNTIGGGTPSKEKPEYWDDPLIVWYTPSDLTKQPAMFAFGSADRINELGLSKSSAKLFPARTVMMTSRATIGEIAIATTEASTNQGFISCVPNDRLSEYHLYFWLHENVELFLSLAGGATFRELRKSTFRDLAIAVPPIELEGKFNEVVGPMCVLIENLLRQNEVLANARDLLLPRLISGDLNVSDLDLSLEPAA